MQILSLSDIAFNITQYLVEHGIIESGKQQLYTFGIRQMMDMALNIITTILIACYFHMLPEILLFTISYLTLRSYAGGYHADTRIKCYFYSTVITVVSVGMMKILEQNIVLLLVLVIIGGLIIYFLAPVENKTKPLRTEARMVYRRRTRILLGVEIIVALSTAGVGILLCLKAVAVALLILSVMLILELNNNKRISGG